MSQTSTKPKLLSEPNLSASSGALAGPDCSSGYLPSLDGIRFFAAFAVLIHHFEQIKSEIGLPSIWNESQMVQFAGKEGVRLFFVLSGFLISLLLIKELKKNSKIDFGKFVMRRILRIWPVYFLTVALAFFVLPVVLDLPASATPNLFACVGNVHQHFLAKLVLYCCFLPNLCLFLFPVVPAAGHCWSLGVEEQFYLFWPFWLFLFRKKLLVGIVSAIGLKYLSIGSLGYFLAHTTLRHSREATDFGIAVINTINTIDAESFGLGALAALFLTNHPKLYEKFARNPFVLGACLCVILLGSSFDFVCRPVAMSCAFAGLIVSLSIKVFSHPIANAIQRFGKISYGIYMYHPFIFFVVLQSLANRAVLDQGPGSFLSFLLCSALVIALSHLSYKYFEAPFLRVKTLFNA